MQRIKNRFLSVCKSLGLFRVARHVTRGRLRIVCYHAFEVMDESNFRPRLFMRGETFEHRMKLLRKQAFAILPLEEALERLANRTLPSSAVVLTIDDGFFSVLSVAGPVLQRYRLPATLYLTSYYAAKQNPIFSLAVQYLFWKSPKTVVDLSTLGVPMLERVTLADVSATNHAIEQVILHGETFCDELKRCALARELGQCLDVDYDALVRSRMVTVLSADEIRSVSRGLLDIQLHTHRHRLPESEEAVRQEIKDNRDFLQGLVEKPLRHLCYPSGVWSRRLWPWLADLQITSATTCMPGLNGPETPRLALRRFLDGEDVSEIEFESELSGFSEVLRSARNVFRRSTEDGAAD